MSDLISRKALIQGFYKHTNGGTQRYLIPEEIWEMVELAPTAYDVDKIVEQLEDKAFEMWDENSKWSNPKVIKLDKAIKIVKGEGNGQTDHNTDKVIEQLEEKFLTEKDFRAKGCWLDAIEIVKGGEADE